MTRTTRHLAGIGLAGLAMLLALTGCGSTHRGLAAVSATTTTAVAKALPVSLRAPAAPKASVRFLTPAPGEIVKSGFVASVRIQGFVLEGPSAGTTPRAGVGHLHFALDGGRFDEPKYAGAAGRRALETGTNGYYSPAYSPAIRYVHIPAGSHALTVTLVNRNDQTTGATATVRFRVR